MGKKEKIEEPPPPPRPEPQKLQVKCVPWSSMNFAVSARLSEYTVGDLRELIMARHGDAIENLELYKGDGTSGDNELTDPTQYIHACGTTTILYDYYPPVDPFENRPVAGQLLSSEFANQVITLRTFENGDKAVIEPEKLKWSKKAESDPWTAKKLAEEKAAADAAEAARKAAEEAEAKRLAEEAAEAKRKKEEEKKAKAEAARKAKEEEEAAAAKAEQRRLQKLEEEAMKDPAKRAEFERKKKEAEMAAKKKEAEEALAKLPPRKKGGAFGLFLGGTTREYYGLHNVTEELPYRLIPKSKMIAEITDKGKIADLYNFKTQIESYKGADDEIMICKDEKEVYGDDGFVMCVDEADKLHFIAHIAAGNGLPPKL